MYQCKYFYIHFLLICWKGVILWQKKKTFFLPNTIFPIKFIYSLGKLVWKILESLHAFFEEKWLIAVSFSIESTVKSFYPWTFAIEEVILSNSVKNQKKTASNYFHEMLQNSSKACRFFSAWMSWSVMYTENFGWKYYMI